MAEVHSRVLTLEDLASVPLPPSFTFVVDGKEYKCQASVAHAISPVIRKNPMVQATSRFVFPGLKDPKNEFPNFMKLISGGEIDITPANAPFFCEIGRRLEIESLYTYSKNIITSIKPGDCMAVLKEVSEQGIEMGGLIDYVVKNWSQFVHRPEIETLPLHCLEEIFGHKGFRCGDVDAFFQLVCRIVETNGHEYCALFRFVDMTRLDSKQMEELLDLVNFDEVPLVLFEQFERRLMCEVADMEEEQDDVVVPQRGPFMLGAHQPWPRQVQDLGDMSHPMYVSQVPGGDFTLPPRASGYTTVQPAKPVTPNTREFKWNPDWDENEEDPVINGVFSYIIRTWPKTWQDLIEVDGGGTKQKMLIHLFEYKQIFKFHWDSYDSKVGIKPENAWLQLHLTAHQLVLKHYSIATSVTRVNSQPKSWRLEASNDGQTWVCISTVRGYQKTKTAKQIVFTTPIQARVAPYSYFKLIQTENWSKANAANAGELRINAIEFYGTLISE